MMLMMLQEARITGQGVHKITSSNGTELFLYNSGHQSTSYGGAGSPVNKNQNNLQIDIGRNQHLNNNHEENEVLFYIRLHPDKRDIRSNINRNVLIIIGGGFNTKAKMRNRDPLLNKIIGKYAKSDINENGEKLIEPSNLHNLRDNRHFLQT